jgi:NADPH:quinone reductase-like Zn-dependent oxidoreductase
MEFAGQVEAVGKGVTSFRAGEPVFGMTMGGANAEYVAVPYDAAIAAKPASLSYEEAAALPFGALAALAFLRDIVRLRPGERILVYGASGAVGVAAVQLAKHFGAEVTGVCSTPNVSLVRSLGADHVIDYTATDFTKGTAVYDVILDTVGGTSFARALRVLSPNGRHVFVNIKLPQLLQMFLTSLRRGKQVICGFSSGSSQSDLRLIKDLVDARVLKPVVDRVYGLNDIVEAHRYVDSGRKRGSVIVAIDRCEPALRRVA